MNELPVVYDHWKGEEWLPNGGRRCRHIPSGCLFDCWIGIDHEERAELREGRATPELFELAKGYYRVFGAVDPANQPPGGISAIAKRVIFPDDDEPFPDFIQRQAPPGWTIKPLGTASYEIKDDQGNRATIEGGRITDGWAVSVYGTGIASEFTVKTPDGRTLWFHDCWNP